MQNTEEQIQDQLMKFLDELDIDAAIRKQMSEAICQECERAIRNAVSMTLREPDIAAEIERVARQRLLAIMKEVSDGKTI